MEFSINRAPSNSADDVSNDRLRKAIERNRAKQSRRQAPSTARAATPSSSRFGGNDNMPGSELPQDWNSPGPSRPSQRRPVAASSNFEAAQSRFDSLASKPSSTPSHVRATRTASTGNTFSSARESATTSARMQRSAGMGRTVEGLNQEQQLIEPKVKRPRSTSANIKYSVPKTNKRKKRAKVNSVSVQRLVKGAWILCLVLLVRLIFTDGGVIDYYSSSSLLKHKNRELKEIKVENTELALEIERIKKDKSYQKKLVRDNLGFIAKNEYLILFPKER